MRLSHLAKPVLILTVTSLAAAAQAKTAILAPAVARAASEADGLNEVAPWVAPPTLVLKGGEQPFAASEGPAGLGFAPLSIVRDGMSYTPGEPANADDVLPMTSAPSPDGAGAAVRHEAGTHALFDGLGFKRLEGLPEPTTWALVLIGFAMIGSALRGFIVANRRLARLRAEENPSVLGD